MKPILITCYVNPDLDGVACAIAYREFLEKNGTNAVVGIIGEPHEEAKYIFDRFNIECPQIIENTDGFDEVMLVDASDLNGFEGKVVPESVIEIIDHRKVHEAERFPNAKAQIELVGAAATLVAEKFIQNKVDISKGSATLLYGAIISNTLNFKGTVCTERDKVAAHWLNTVAKLSTDFWKDLFIAKSDITGEKLAQRIKDGFAWFTLGDKKVGIAQIEMIGAHALVTERSDEIVRTLETIKNEMGLDFIFQNTIELDDAKNFFVARDSETQKLLGKVLDVQFSGDAAERPNMILRKQIVPMLKEELE